MKKNNYPIAVTEDIVIKELADEILVYDLKANKALCLNKTSAMIWQHCDGTNDITEIGKKLSFQLKSTVTNELVEFALLELEEQGLLKTQVGYSNKFSGISRREVIKKISLSSAIALPLISSVVAPSALDAQSMTCIADDITSPCTFGPGCFPTSAGGTTYNCPNSACCSGNCRNLFFAGGETCGPIV